MSSSISSASVSSAAQASAPAASAPAASAPTASAPRRQLLPARPRRTAGLLPASRHLCGQRGPRISVPRERVPAMSAAELCLPGKQWSHGHQWCGHGEIELQSVAACRGAFLICLSGDHFCESGRRRGGRLAGSDFVIPAGTTSDVAVALTALGEQVVSDPGGFSATVLVDLLDYGTVLNTTGSTRSGQFQPDVDRSANLPDRRHGKLRRDRLRRAGHELPVRGECRAGVLEFLRSSGRWTTVTAVVRSRVKHTTMQCTGGSPVACTGGTNAARRVLYLRSRGDGS